MDLKNGCEVTGFQLELKRSLSNQEFYHDRSDNGGAKEQTVSSRKY